MHRPHTPLLLSPVLYLAACLLVLGACSPPPVLDPAPRAATAAYPEDAPLGPDLDVVVVRERGQIRLVNREARSFGPGELWLNAQYVRPVQRIEIGTDNQLDLEAFRNGFEEPYPTGTFFRPEQNRRLVLAELYDPRANVRYRLTVQPEEQPRTN